MDNQQERLKLDLSWLAGIIDGEGTISLRVRNRKHQSTLITPVVSITNTNYIIMYKVIEILKENNIPHWVHETNYNVTKNPLWKSALEVQIMGIKRCSIILPIIYNYLVGKKDQCELVMNWCLSRKDDFGKRKYYSEEDLKIANQVKELHGHKLVLKSSETIRQTQ
jgi:hypothetical protein